MKENRQGTLITPTPGLVVKGLSEEGKKIFINICFSSFLRNPHPTADGRMRVPMSIGELVPDVDKKGNPCLVIDVVVSEETVKVATVDLHSKAELVHLITEGIQSKHNLSVSSLRPLKLGYKGSSVRPQRIRLEKSDMVRDVSEIVISNPCNPVLPVFEFILRNNVTGEELNVLKLPQYESTARILQKNMLSITGRSEKDITCSVGLSGFDCMCIQINSVRNPALVRMQVSCERLVIRNRDLPAQSELNVCCSSHENLVIVDLVPDTGLERKSDGNFQCSAEINTRPYPYLISIEFRTYGKEIGGVPSDLDREQLVHPKILVRNSNSAYLRGFLAAKFVRLDRLALIFFRLAIHCVGHYLIPGMLLPSYRASSGKSSFSRDLCPSLNKLSHCSLQCTWRFALYLFSESILIQSRQIYGFLAILAIFNRPMKL